MKAAYKFETEDFERAIQDFGLENTTAAVVDTVAQKNPDLFSYETLRSGTAPLFDQLPGYEGLGSEARRLSDEEILEIFTNVENPGAYTTGAKAFARGLVKGAAATPAGIFAYKIAEPVAAGFAAAAFPQVATGLAVAKVLQIGSGLAAATAALNMADDGLNAVFGKPDPIVPSLAYARTTGNIVGEAVPASRYVSFMDGFEKLGVQPLKNLGSEVFLNNFKNVARARGHEGSAIQQVDELIEKLNQAQKGLKLPKSKILPEKITDKIFFEGTKLRGINKDSPEYLKIVELSKQSGLSPAEFIRARKIGQQASVGAESKMETAEGVRKALQGAFGAETGAKFSKQFSSEAALEAGIKTPKLANIVRGLEKSALSGLDFARKEPLAFNFYEAVGIGGMGLATAVYEAQDPFAPESEIVGGLVGPAVGSSLVQPTAKLAELSKDLGKGIVDYTLKKLGVRSDVMTKEAKEGVARIELAIENSPAFRNILQGKFEGKNIDNLSNKEYKDARDALFTEIYDIIEAGALKVVDGQEFKTGPVEALAEAGMGDLAKTVKKISETIGEGREQLSQASEKGKARLLSVAVEAIETLRASGNAEAFKEIAILQKAIYEEEILGDINKGMTPMISALNQLIKKVDSDDIDAAVDESDEISTRLYNLLSTQMKATKDRERRLWNKTKQYKLWDFYTPTGEKIDQPFTLKTILDIERELTEAVDPAGLEKFRGALFGPSGLFGADLKTAMMSHFLKPDGTVRSREELEKIAQNSPWNSTNAQNIRSRLLTRVAELQKGVESGGVDKVLLKKVADAALRDVQGRQASFKNMKQLELPLGNEPNEADAVQAYNDARAYTAARKDVFARYFLGEKVFGIEADRALKLEPEELMEKMFSGGLKVHSKRAIDKILEAGQFGVEKAIGYEDLSPEDLKLLDSVFLESIDSSKLSAEFMDLSIRSATEMAVREVFRKYLLRPGNKTDQISVEGITQTPEFVVDEKKLAAFKRSAFGKNAMQEFPDLVLDLQDVQSANAAYRAFQQAPIAEETRQAARALNSVVKFGEANPSLAIEKALKPSESNPNPQASMNGLLKAIDDAFTVKDGDKVLQRKSITVERRDPDTGEIVFTETFTKDDVLSGLRNAIFDLATFEAKGYGNEPISGSRLQEFLFKEQPYGKGDDKFKLIDWMESNGIISKQKGPDGKTHRQTIEEAVEQMANIENMFYTGDLDANLFKQPTPAQLFQVRMIGATLGARSQGQFNDLMSGIFGSRGATLGGGMVAAEAGSSLLQNLMFGIPETKTLQAMAEVLSDSGLMAQFGKQITKEQKPESIFEKLKAFATRLPAESLRRRIPAVLATQEREEPTTPIQVQPQLQGAATPPTMSPPPAAPSPAPTGPVDRSQYAALFPNDIASGLIRQQQRPEQQGIGSLV